MILARAAALAVLLLTGGLAGCGAAPAAGKAKTPVLTGIFTSAQDCAASLKLPLSDCSAFVDKAIASHAAKSKSYISKRLCEQGEGSGRCERLSENEFRPRLVAFLVTVAKPPVPEPLYSPKEPKAPSFATAGNAKTLLVVDEMLTVSTSAKAVAESLMPTKRR